MQMHLVVQYQKHESCKQLLIRHSSDKHVTSANMRHVTILHMFSIHQLWFQEKHVTLTPMHPQGGWEYPHVGSSWLLISLTLESMAPHISSSWLLTSLTWESMVDPAVSTHPSQTTKGQVLATESDDKDFHQVRQQKDRCWPTRSDNKDFHRVRR